MPERRPGAGRVRLVIEKLGPLRGAVLDFGDVTVLVGSPNSGKSLALKALYTSLSILDRSVACACRACAPPRRAVELVVNFDGLDLVARLVAAAALAASQAVAPHEAAKLMGVPIVRHTVKYRESSETARAIQVEFRVKKEHQASLAWVNVERLAPALIKGYSECLKGSLVPGDASFALKDLEALGSRGPLRVGAFYTPLLIEEDVVSGGCRVHVVEARAELTLSGDRLVIRGLDVNLEVNRECDTQRLHEGVARVLSEGVTYIEGRLSSRFTSRAVKSLRKVVRELVGLDDAVYIPYFKAAALGIRLAMGLRALDPRTLARLLSLMSSRETLPLNIFLYRLDRGLRAFADAGWRHNILKSIAVVVGEGSLELGRDSVEYVSGGVGVPMHLASALAAEVFSMLLALNSVGRGRKPLVVIEEPEAQLHPNYQLAMGFAVAALAKALGAVIAFSTHSDLVAFPLAFLKEYRPTPSDVASILSKATGRSPDDPDVALISKLAAEAAGLDVKIYHIEKGAVVPVQPGRMLSEMPSLSDATLLVLDASTKALLGRRRAGES